MSKERMRKGQFRTKATFKKVKSTTVALIPIYAPQSGQITIKNPFLFYIKTSYMQDVRDEIKGVSDVFYVKNIVSIQKTTTDDMKELNSIVLFKNSKMTVANIVFDLIKKEARCKRFHVKLYVAPYRGVVLVPKNASGWKTKDDTIMTMTSGSIIAVKSCLPIKFASNVKRLSYVQVGELIGYIIVPVEYIKTKRYKEGRANNKRKQ